LGLTRLIAHKDAYEKCGILHWNVSGSNVMMKDNDHGVLNEWDQARRVADMANMLRVNLEYPQPDDRTTSISTIPRISYERYVGKY